MSKIQRLVYRGGRIDEVFRRKDLSNLYAGTNFVAWYRRVSPERLGAAVDLLGDLRDVLPSFESLSLIATGEDARALEAVFGRPPKRSRYRLGQLSDGQRALIALYGLLRFCGGGAGRASQAYRVREWRGPVVVSGGERDHCQAGSRR